MYTGCVPEHKEVRAANALVAENKQAGAKAQSRALDSASELLSIAHRFNVSSLVEHCGVVLSDTVCAAKCTSFVKADPAQLTVIMASDGYAQLSRESISHLLASFIPAN